jgi:hypothetical protein
LQARANDPLLDIRAATIGFALNDTGAELVITPIGALAVLYNLRGGQETLVEGSPEFVVSVLAKAGISAVIRVKEGTIWA